jgi:acetolactate synthase-1/2/3 large subunit
MEAERSGGRILVDALALNGVDTVYCVPGESFLAALDAFVDKPQIQVVACRHESAAANMADAYGKLTGRPGICFVTRGPGATHASVGIHTAMQDSTPLLLFVGQVARGMLGREAFQEIDVPAVFGGLAKWAVTIDDTARIPEIVARAFETALSGRPGPVVIALPEDMLRERAVVADAPPARATQAQPSDADLARLHELLARAERPLVVLGGSGWTEPARDAMRRFLERNALPAVASFRRQTLLDNRSPSYVGDMGVGINPALAERVKAADLIIAAGARLGEMPTSGYTLLDIPRPKQRLVHVHADANELGRVYHADLAINASPANFALALETLAPLEQRPWAGWTAGARADYEQNLTSPSRGALDLAEVVRTLSATLPGNAIVCNGAGNHTAWVHRFYQYKGFDTQLAPTSGAMGYGVPAAIAAKLRYPERIVVAVAGDGCFLMTGQELATAVQYGAAIVVLVVNNAMYGTIRMHQERAYPGRVIATDLVNPDFVGYARSFGAYGERVERTSDFAAAFERATRAGVPALLELIVDPGDITPRTTLAAIRESSARLAAD